MPASTTPEATERPAGAADAPPPTYPKPDRTTLYGQRLDAHVADDVPEGERLKFFCDLRLWWLAEYERWIERVDAERQTAADLGISAWDFVLTIALLDERIARLRGDK